jgi:hypothetical protein
MARNPAECTRRIRVFEHLLERRQIAVDVVQNGQHASPRLADANAFAS